MSVTWVGFDVYTATNTARFNIAKFVEPTPEGHEPANH
jgi:hypothetical protein